VLVTVLAVDDQAAAVDLDPDVLIDVNAGEFDDAFPSLLIP
jgi:hypothetical protein